MASWSDLPLDLLGVVLACFRSYPGDRVRIGAVCRSWRSAVRHHEHRRLPWVVSWEDRVYIPFDFDCLPLRFQYFPEGGVCVAGSTDSWLAVGLGTKYELEGLNKFIYDSYVMHDPFSNTTVPLTLLNDIIANIGTCQIYKFLMRSNVVDDFIAVVTDNVKYPLIVFRQGKGAWVAEPYKAPCIYIIDVAFLGDTLYAITQSEDLIPLHLASDGDGKPVVTIGKRIIKGTPGFDDYDRWSSSDDDGNDEEEEEQENDDDDGDDDDDDINEMIEYDGNIEEDEDDVVDGEHNLEDEVAHDDDAQEEDDGSHRESFSVESTHDVETGELILITRHLIMSSGKLLIVRRHKIIPSGDAPVFTRRIDVLEANTNTGTWVPLPVGSGLGGSQALFISLCFSKSVSAPCGEVEADVIYDLNTGEVFDMKSQTSRQRRFCKPSRGITWLFPPELVL